MNNGYSHGKLLGGVWRKVGNGEGDSQKRPLLCLNDMGLISGRLVGREGESMNNQASIHHRQRFSNEFNTQFLISIAFDGIFSTVVNVVLSFEE